MSVSAPLLVLGKLTQICQEQYNFSIDLYEEGYNNVPL